MRKKRPICDSDFSAIVVPSMHGSGYLDYRVETHASRSLKAMEEFRKQEMLCDLVLHVKCKDKTTDFKVSPLLSQHSDILQNVQYGNKYFWLLFRLRPARYSTINYHSTISKSRAKGTVTSP